MNKRINTNADIMQVKWHNHSYKINIYNKLPNAKHTQGADFVKFKNVSHIT